LGKLNQIVADLIYKINRINNWELKIRFTWCPAHIGIKHNEKVDFLAKEASLTGTPFNNYIIMKVILASLRYDYMDIDKRFILKKVKMSLGKYYLNKFSDVKFKYPDSI